LGPELSIVRFFFVLALLASWRLLFRSHLSNVQEAILSSDPLFWAKSIQGEQQMIRRMSHAAIFVNNQEEALQFYRDKLGFQVHTDAMVGPDFRWLTLNTQDDPDFELVLMEIKSGMLMDESTATQLREILAKGVLGAGVFNTDDCRGTYEELKSKGVQFVSEPADRPYGVEAVFKDNSGNWFSLTQPSEGRN
jgi:predicted enzyme related to lactoylglutathione lyase